MSDFDEKTLQRFFGCSPKTTKDLLDLALSAVTDPEKSIGWAEYGESDNPWRNSSMPQNDWYAFRVNEVWKKGKLIPGLDPNIWREDEEGNMICRDHYGNTNSKYGWEIDHIYPESKGGGNGFDNLRPLQWEANRKKSNKLLR